MGMILVFTTETINSRVLMLLVKISVHHNLSNSVSTESSCLILAIFALLASAQYNGSNTFLKDCWYFYASPINPCDIDSKSL